MKRRRTAKRKLRPARLESLEKPLRVATAVSAPKAVEVVLPVDAPLVVKVPSGVRPVIAHDHAARAIEIVPVPVKRDRRPWWKSMWD